MTNDAAPIGQDTFWAIGQMAIGPPLRGSDAPIHQGDRAAPIERLPDPIRRIERMVANDRPDAAWIHAEMRKYGLADWIINAENRA